MKETGFSFVGLRHAPGVGLGGTMGGLVWYLIVSIPDLCNLTYFGVQKMFSRNSTRFGVRVTCMNGTCNGTIFGVPAPWGLGEGL